MGTLNRTPVSSLPRDSVPAKGSVWPGLAARTHQAAAGALASSPDLISVPAFPVSARTRPLRLRYEPSLSGKAGPLAWVPEALPAC